MMDPLQEAARWERRAEENRTKAECYTNAWCRATMISLADQYDRLSERALTHAIAIDGLFRQGHVEEAQMLSKGGLHPYDEGLIFCLRDFKTRGPKSRSAIVSGDVDSICQRMPVVMLAKMFNKSNREVARDLIKLDRSLENGRP